MKDLTFTGFAAHTENINRNGRQKGSRNKMTKVRRLVDSCGSYEKFVNQLPKSLQSKIKEL